MFPRITQIINTAQYLKPRQVFYQVWYRFKKQIPLQQKRRTLAIHTERLHLIPFIFKPNSYHQNSFTFLNLSLEYPSVSDINWDEPAFGKLWTYNLNYFDFLLQHELPVQTGKFLIDDFISKYVSLHNAKEPYTLSLRGMNWIKWISINNIVDEQFRDRFNSLLFQQYRSLIKNIEYHLLGNHLLENAFSLLFGSFYFSDRHLFKKAGQILVHQLEEQILSDGAHFELSPMYHQIMLDRVLDCTNLIQNNSVFPEKDEILSLFRIKASAMLGWLEQVTFSQGDIPLVNDSAPGMAPSTRELLSYAERLNISATNIPLKESGYRMFRREKFELLVDIGIPGPDYIPGHAHADIFNFVLYMDGKPCIVDTGTSTYDVGEIRFRERSTAAHNTVQVNDREQSETWSAFRMGRRAKPVLVKDTPKIISGYHTGFNPNIHEREFSIGENGFKIIDRISGPEHKAVTYFHFYPGSSVEIHNNEIVLLNCNIHVQNAAQIAGDQYQFALGFNSLVVAPLIKVYFQQYLETEFEF